ncbi:VOC family protein [Haloechinothrix sp. LS1_15]|uniref:VOC family protein n=1 Tax=Haloechinothrix sp. LS1_15 TaxID=2652248 RepID=UPI002947CCF4|nr:VOC family protein [Haloechinothrix sp. LS1_15]MDV6012323.1 VOC family protein [Haloechinothrix sp. LS1_15]
MDGSAPIGLIREIVLDTPDPWSLARFWSGLLGGTPVEWYPGWVTLEPPPHGQRLSFQASEGSWGEAHCPAHFDILVHDLERGHEAVLARGGTYVGERYSPRAGAAGETVPWRVYRDPDGHPFCLVVR